MSRAGSSEGWVAGWEVMSELRSDAGVNSGAGRGLPYDPSWEFDEIIGILKSTTDR